MQSPMARTMVSSSIFVYASAASACWFISSEGGMRVARSSGPQWVWEAFSTRCDGGRPCSFCARSAMARRMVRGTPMRSSVTSAMRAPAASSITSVFAKRSCAAPSEGLFLPA